MLLFFSSSCVSWNVKYCNSQSSWQTKICKLTKKVKDNMITAVFLQKPTACKGESVRQLHHPATQEQFGAANWLHKWSWWYLAQVVLLETYIYIYTNISTSQNGRWNKMLTFSFGCSEFLCASSCKMFVLQQACLPIVLQDRFVQIKNILVQTCLDKTACTCKDSSGIV